MKKTLDWKVGVGYIEFNEHHKCARISAETPVRRDFFIKIPKTPELREEPRHGIVIQCA